MSELSKQLRNLAGFYDCVSTGARCESPYRKTLLGAADELERLESEVAELRKPHFYLDDRSEYDNVGDVIEVRPIHELPTTYALVLEYGTAMFASRQEAEAAARKENRDDRESK